MNYLITLPESSNIDTDVLADYLEALGSDIVNIIKDSPTGYDDVSRPMLLLLVMSNMRELLNEFDSTADAETCSQLLTQQIWMLNMYGYREMSERKK